MFNIKYISFIGLMIFSHQGLSGCISTLIEKPSINFSGTLTVQRDANIGEIIAEGVASVTAEATESKDNTNNPSQFFVKIEGFNEQIYTTSKGKKVYKTNLDGVGLLIDSDLDENNSVTVDIATIPQKGPGTANNYFKYYLVKTGTITPGILSGIAYQKIGYVCLGASNTKYYTEAGITNITGGATIKVLSCSLNTNPIIVPMGKTSPRYFNGKGTKDSVSEDTNFTISLNCDPSTNVKMQIDGSSGNFDSTNGILNINPSSSGSGVGIQLLLNNNIFPLAQLNSVKNNSNEGNVDIEMSARYIQTSEEIKPGEIQAQANLTLKYQ